MNNIAKKNKLKVDNFISTLLTILLLLSAHIGYSQDSASKSAENILAEMVFIKGDTFLMGSSDWDNTSESNEKPQHKVILSDFYLGKYEITQKQYLEIMGEEIKANYVLKKRKYTSFGSLVMGNIFNSVDLNLADTYPIILISWYDAINFCNKLSIKEGLSPYYFIEPNGVSINSDSKGYRLPTESEWEFAAKGGILSHGYRYSGSDKLNKVAWFNESGGKPYKGIKISRTVKPGGLKQPNELDLYDMSGNVWEWCFDWYDRYPCELQLNPTGPQSGKGKVVRGCSFNDGSHNCRIPNRNKYPPDFNGILPNSDVIYVTIGFRIARSK